MKKIKHTITGHQTFYLREGWLNKGINFCEKKQVNGKISSDVFSKNHLIENSDELGIGSVMVSAIKFWMLVFGVIEKSGKDYILNTKLVNTIKERDKYLLNDNTLWILHLNVFNNANEKFIIWESIFNKYQDYSKFSKDEFLEIVKENIKEINLKKENAKKIEVSDGTINDSLQTFIKTYYSNPKDMQNPEDNISSPFSRLKYISEGLDEKIRIRKISSDEISEYLVYYFIKIQANNSLDWKQLSLEEISFKNLYSNFNSFIKMDYIEFEKLINKLINKEIVAYSKAGGLDKITLLKQLTFEDVVEKIYERKG